MTRVFTFAMLLLSCALVRPALAQGSPSWRLLFAVDSAGVRIEGDKTRLIDAVRAGRPVRVGWRLAYRLPDGTAGNLEHVATASFLTIHHGEVFAQIPPILGQRPAAREASIALRTEGDQLWYGLLDTTGRLVGYFTGTGASQTTRVPTYWYVEGT
jgi:hypothetical protein